MIGFRRSMWGYPVKSFNCEGVPIFIGTTAAISLYNSCSIAGDSVGRTSLGIKRVFFTLRLSASPDEYRDAAILKLFSCFNSWDSRALRQLTDRSELNVNYLYSFNCLPLPERFRAGRRGVSMAIGTTRQSPCTILVPSQGIPARPAGGLSSCYRSPLDKGIPLGELSGCFLFFCLIA